MSCTHFLERRPNPTALGDLGALDANAGNSEVLAGFRNDVPSVLHLEILGKAGDEKRGSLAYFDKMS
jgi:hypothetical protein